MLVPRLAPPPGFPGPAKGIVVFLRPLVSLPHPCSQLIVVRGQQGLAAQPETQMHHRSAPRPGSTHGLEVHPRGPEGWALDVDAQTVTTERRVWGDGASSTVTPGFWDTCEGGRMRV